MDVRAFKFFKKIIDNTSQGSVGILKCAKIPLPPFH